MATHAGHLIQDQNLVVHFDGAPVGGKSGVSKAQKKGFGGRKVLNDISNSGKPSALQASKKHNSINVISVGEDLGVTKNTRFTIGGKKNVLKAPEKAKIGGRKVLGDLTNSGKPSVHQPSKKNHDNKPIAVAEEENLASAVAEERFLHNHKNCIKSQRKAVDINCFLMTVGLDEDISMQLAPKQEESPLKHLKLEEISELMMIEDYPHCRKIELHQGEQKSPLCGSPNSPKPYMRSKDYNFPNFILMATP